MQHASGLAAVAILIGLGLVHFYWAAGGHAGKAAAIPTRDGRPVIRPSSRGTALVGLALVVAASIVAAVSGLFSASGAAPILRACGALLALAFVARAVGDFRYVGLFKTIRGSPFARCDSCLYSPVCACLGLLIAIASFWT